MKSQKKHVIAGLLMAILVAAMALRSYHISTLPSGIFPDEAQNGVDAELANATANHKLFYETNNGREGLFINLQSLSIKYLGNTVLGLKFWSITFGTLTVLGVFLLASEIFQSQIAGLVGAYLIAFSYWAINFSRIGFRAIMLPFILTWAFYFVLKGLRTKKLSDFILGGFIYGLGLHTYIAFRTSPLALIVLFIFLIISKKHFLKEYWKQVLVFAMAMFIAAAPMLLDFFVWNPQHYTSRTSEISVFNPDNNHGHLLLTVARTLGLSLAKYNFWGDQNMRQNYPPYPLLNPVTGVTFFIGFIYCIVQFFRLTWVRFSRGERDEKLVTYAFLLAWIFALLIPEFLAAEGNPHALRSIGTLPVVIIMAVFPFMWIIKRYNNYGHAFKKFVLSSMIMIFAFIAIFDPVKYFVFFANSPEQHGAFDANLMKVSDYLRALPAGTEKYVITGSMERLTINYLNPTMPNLHYVYPGEIDNINPENLSTAVFIFTGQDWDSINGVRNRLSGLNYHEHHYPLGDTFYTLSQN